MKAIYENYFRKKNLLNPVLEALNHVPIFENLLSSELKEVAKLTHERTYKKNEFIFKKMAPAEGMYVILSGNVQIVDPDSDITITSLKTNTDVRVSKRLFLPESKLRGFKSGKVGPKDGADYVGGNYMASFNTALSLPFLFPTFDKVDFAIFFDAANLWHVDYSKNVDQGNTVRTATGVAVDIITPMGPLSFSFSKPITKADGDTTQGFRFNLGTTF